MSDDPRSDRVRNAEDAALGLFYENERLRGLHAENARILGFLVNELQGRIDGGKLAALSLCLDRSNAAIADPKQP